VHVPISELLKPQHFGLCTTEIFGPLQVVASHDDATLPLVLAACEGMPTHLTAAIVSSDRAFQRKVLGSTVSGTTYCGARARTTGAPQNHWFGPAGVSCCQCSSCCSTLVCFRTLELLSRSSTV
jgi:1-pyrroline-5-carboxylate dehydrogenase